MLRSLVWSVILIGTALLSSSVTSCRRSSEQRSDDAARQAGREAHRATQDLEREANKAAKQLRDAGNQFRDGWKQDKHDSPDNGNGNENKPNPDR